MMTSKKGFIFDIDGTLTHEGSAIPGAVQVIQTLREQALTLRFATNGTGKTPAEIADHLTAQGFDVAASEILTSVTACQHLLATEFQHQSGRYLLPGRTRKQFNLPTSTPDMPNFIVLGDLEDEFNNRLMNELFQQIRAGAQLIVFHRNLYFQHAGETRLDSGAYTLALEQATGKPAIVTGKPSTVFFQQIANTMSLPLEDIVVVGDDLSTDIWGANQSGIDSILVQTGKYTAGLRHPQATPTDVMQSIADITLNSSR